MKINGVILKSLLAGAIALSCSNAFGGTVTIGSATAQVGGGATNPSQIPVTFTRDAGDTTAGIECRVVTPVGVTVSSADAVSGTGTLCAHNPVGGYVLVSVAPDNNSPESGVKCNITYTVDAGAVDGDVFTLTSEVDGNPGGDCAFNDATPAVIPGTLVEGAITVVAESPLTVDIDETPIDFGGGTTGTPATGTFTGEVIDAVGGTGGETASVVCSSDTAGLTVSPTSVTGIENGDADLTFTVSWTYGAALNGNIECTVTDSDGEEHDFTVPVTALAGTDGPPVLTPAPASGSTITLPVSQPGATVSSNIRITPTGGAGTTEAATVTCSSGGVVTVNPSTQLSFLPGSAPQNVAVQCLLLEDEEQTDTVTCTGADGSGDIDWTFDVVCPAGVNTPAIVPATSAWSKFALIALFAGLGALLIGFRRQQ